MEGPGPGKKIDFLGQAFAFILPRTLSREDPGWGMEAGPPKSQSQQRGLADLALWLTQWKGEGHVDSAP